MMWQTNFMIVRAKYIIHGLDKTVFGVGNMANYYSLLYLCDLDLWPLTLTFCMDVTFVTSNHSWKFHDNTMMGT